MQAWLRWFWIAGMLTVGSIALFFTAGICLELCFNFWRNWKNNQTLRRKLAKLTGDETNNLSHSTTLQELGFTKLSGNPNVIRLWGKKGLFRIGNSSVRAIDETLGVWELPSSYNRKTTALIKQTLTKIGFQEDTTL